MEIKSESFDDITQMKVELETEVTSRPTAQSLIQMFSIDGPAKVQNVDNFVKCCGGMQTIQTTFSTPKERLQFKFRPDDPNSIPLFSGRKSSTDLAVKVRKKKKPDGTYDYKFETMGVIDTTFHFEDKICDLQLLPTQSDIRNELLKSDFILNCDANISLEESESNTLMKHFFYSRFTSPKSIFFDMSEQSKRELHITNQDMICQLRKSRRMFGSFVKWEEDNVPNDLSEENKQRIPAGTYKDEAALKLKELFDRRPMWSRHALLLITQCRYTKLKYILPIYAFCYLNGPFRNLWVRYGYNPKTDKSSKIYQSIDCRYRGAPTEALRNKVTLFKDHSTSQRPDFVSPFTYLDESRVSSGLGDNLIDEETPQHNETDYIFRPGQISIFKRTIYQLCDIEIDEAQKIIAENDGLESECTEKDGWCAKGAIDRIRKVMLGAANKMLEDPEIVKRLEKQELQEGGDGELEMDDIEVSEVYDHLGFNDVNDLLMIETREEGSNSRDGTPSNS